MRDGNQRREASFRDRGYRTLVDCSIKIRMTLARRTIEIDLHDRPGPNNPFLFRDYVLLIVCAVDEGIRNVGNAVPRVGFLKGRMKASGIERMVDARRIRAG